MSARTVDSNSPISFIDLSDVVSQHPTSKAASGVIAVVILIIAAAYAIGFYYLYRYALQHPKALNKTSGVLLQRYAPIVYGFLIFSSLIEIAIATWLLVQFHHTSIYPNVGARVGLRLTLFASCWTLLFSTVYLVLFLHPTLSKHPFASLGSQAIWVLVSWCFWVVCTATLNRAVPLLTAWKTCAGSVYCSQLRAAFAFSVIEMLVLTIGMLILAYLVWRCARGDGPVPVRRL